ncbi:lysostaphin resistance A-like protein [Dokdonella sp.]|uniref:CPBP family intramembrane glutamic endopeptidase n=1 Tax=Dokdonella sp. TaxID=2291710 RepID=UPI003529A532
MSTRAIATYIALVFALSWSLQTVAIGVSLGQPDSPAAMPWLIAAMFVPGLVALAFIAVFKPSRTGLLWKPSIPMIPMIALGIAIPAATAFAVLAIVQAAGWGHSGWFQFSASGADISGGPWLLGTGNQSWPLLLTNIAVTGALFAGISALVAVGEEFGWRGFLQQHLIERWGLGRGIVVLGLVWSFYHLPVLLYGYNYPETPILGAFLISPIQLVAVSMFMAWLTLRAGSFWPAAIAHGAGNSIQEGVISNLALNTSPVHKDLVTLAVTVLVGLVCWWSLRNARRQSSKPAPAVLEIGDEAHWSHPVGASVVQR